MKHRSISAVAFAFAAAMTLAACGADSGSDTASSQAATTSTASNFESGKTQEGLIEGEAPPTTTPPNLATPTAQELNSRINRAFDRSVGSQEKTAWVQDAERDPQLVDKLVDAAERNKVKVSITGVRPPENGKLKADADVSIDGKPVQDAFVEFVAEDDQWKVSNQFTCNIVRTAKLDSAACQAR
ncbi:hypothetical protein [Nocardia bovistercoris]|uniref:Low molecular weight antigen MTB12-like C-terminal domain-containing protein n=1 Tax=Nocardia bovistercoris TaxID=2785916 RepID=A0A931IDD1_9NOCA|nr:hypothetical protein [Nocardia bovistercoris]